MGTITVDTREWPLVRVTFDKAVDDDQFDAYVKAHYEVLDRDEPYVILFDTRMSGTMSAAQRQEIAEFMRRRKDDIARLCKLSVFVISNPVVRGMLTTVLWLQPLPCPHEVVASIDAAEQLLEHERRRLLTTSSS
jgi:hypothetical protein